MSRTVHIRQRLDPNEIARGRCPGKLRTNYSNKPNWQLVLADANSPRLLDIARGTSRNMAARYCHLFKVFSWAALLSRNTVIGPSWQATAPSLEHPSLIPAQIRSDPSCHPPCFKRCYMPIKYVGLSSISIGQSVL